MAGKPANDLDASLGARIRAARIGAELSQRAAGRALGVSAAQFQKYEKGSNRISETDLLVFGELVGQPIAAFFADVPEAKAA